AIAAHVNLKGEERATQALQRDPLGDQRDAGRVYCQAEAVAIGKLAHLFDRLAQPRGQLAMMGSLVGIKRRQITKEWLFVCRFALCPHLRSFLSGSAPDAGLRWRRDESGLQKRTGERRYF